MNLDQEAEAAAKALFAQLSSAPEGVTGEKVRINPKTKEMVNKIENFRNYNDKDLTTNFNNCQMIINGKLHNGLCKGKYWKDDKKNEYAMKVVMKERGLATN